MATDGTASISSQGAPEPRPARADSTLAAGETLRTGADSSVSAFLLPGAFVHLGAESALRIKELALTKNGNATDEAMSRQIHLDVSAGTIDFVVQFEPTVDAWSVSTAFGLISTRTRGGTCRVQVTAHGFRLTVLHGQFTVRVQGWV